MMGSEAYSCPLGLAQYLHDIDLARERATRRVAVAYGTQHVTCGTAVDSTGIRFRELVFDIILRK